MERSIEFRIEHLNELGDLCFKTLVVEIMGKHSNIIFLNEDRMILDSIKHVSCNVSSVREVLPGRGFYFLPKTQEKANSLNLSKDTFYDMVYTKPMAVSKGIYTSLTGISPCIAEGNLFSRLCGAEAFPLRLLMTLQKSICSTPLSVSWKM